MTYFVLSGRKTLTPCSDVVDLATQGTSGEYKPAAVTLRGSLSRTQHNSKWRHHTHRVAFTVHCIQLLLCRLQLALLSGESGLGKSTLINSMFLTDIYNSDYPGPSVRGKKTVEVRVTLLSSFLLTYTLCWVVNVCLAGWLAGWSFNVAQIRLCERRGWLLR